MQTSWTPTNIAWLAGIIEGEGCIRIERAGFSVSVQMTDHDVIRKLRDITGVGVLHGPILTRHKPLLRWKITLAKDAYAVCAAIYSFMGARRQARILEVMEAYRSKRPILKYIHGTDSRYRSGCRCDKCRAARSAYLKAA